MITYAPREGVDLTLIFGVNEERYDPKTCQVISTSTCDANAVAPVLGILDQNFGIESGYVTTLHPWLPYQNLTDGSIRSVTSPTHFWNDFSLGRASTLSLLPKDTTLIDAIGLAMPDVAARLSSMSFRVPTTIVSASDMTITLGKETTAEGINMVLRDAARENGHIFGCGAEHLVSIDYLKTEQSFIADERWTQVIAGRTAKLILWYDNEWGYSNRVADAVELLASHFD